MSAAAVNSATFLGQGRIRIGIVALCLVVVLILAFSGYFPIADAVIEKINKRTEAAYSALFTFLAVFWAAVLTIWSLLKSRATRYVERLSDNVVFLGFMRELETRLIVGMIVVVLSFMTFIINPSVSVPADGYTYLIGTWVVFYGATIFLLVDSLLTARVLL